MTPLVARQRQHYGVRGRPKVAHPSAATATAHLARIVARDSRIKGKVYRCCVCGGWHVGNAR